MEPGYGNNRPLNRFGSNLPGGDYRIEGYHQRPDNISDIYHNQNNNNNDFRRYSWDIDPNLANPNNNQPPIPNPQMNNQFNNQPSYNNPYPTLDNQTEFGNPNIGKGYVFNQSDLTLYGNTNIYCGTNPSSLKRTSTYSQNQSKMGRSMNRPNIMPSSPEDTIKAFITTSQSKVDQAVGLRKKNDIHNAILTLEKAIKSLNDLKIMIETKKQEFQNYLPKINEISSEGTKLLCDYNYELYTYSNSGDFAFKPKADMQEINYYLLSLKKKPFIYENDIFLEEKEIFTKITELWHNSLRTNRKTLLLYGPKGCGKSLLAQKLATESGCAYIQIDNFDLLDTYNLIPATFKYIGALHPVVFHIKKFENLWKNPKLLYFFLEKATEDKFANFKFFVIYSTDQPKANIPRDILCRIGNRLMFIPPFINKSKYVDFVCKRLKMETNFSSYDNESMNQDLMFYSNQQIFQGLYEIRSAKLQNSNNEPLIYSQVTKQFEPVVPDLTQAYLNSFY